MSGLAEVIGFAAEPLQAEDEAELGAAELPPRLITSGEAEFVRRRLAELASIEVRTFTRADGVLERVCLIGAGSVRLVVSLRSEGPVAHLAQVQVGLEFGAVSETRAIEDAEHLAADYEPRVERCRGERICRPVKATDLAAVIASEDATEEDEGGADRAGHAAAALG